MATRECPRCKEINTESSRVCIICGDSLGEVEAVGVSEKDKNTIYKSKVSDKAKKRGYTCPNCDFRSNVYNSTCVNCGFDIASNGEKTYYNNTASYNGSSNVGVYILSFLIPLVGFIIGAIWIAGDRKEEGTMAIVLGIVGIVMSSIILSLIYY